ncbi:formate dehydrogenase accessory sulfurtransferase FdhD [Patescibacteria group bacterium]|nr:formate dehydrogenase accessory sulfurtransferase FdhD [Patescibacteria group bacterium]
MSILAKGSQVGLSKKVNIVQIISERRERLKDEIVREIPLTILVNEKELVTLQCSPHNLEYLAIGFLLSEGIIRRGTGIEDISLSEKGWYIRVSLTGDFSIDKYLSGRRIIGSGCSGAFTFYRDVDAQGCVPLQDETEYSYQKISSLMRQFQQNSLTFKHTGGVHSCALCSQEGIELFAEDIGRHNAVDKIFGECYIRGISTQDKAILTSGRVSSEILIKAVKQKVPIIASHSAPTDLAVGLAEKLNLTLIGFVRGCRMNIYTNNYRII